MKEFLIPSLMQWKSHKLDIFWKSVRSENHTTEICRSQGPGVHSFGFQTSQRRSALNFNALRSVKSIPPIYLHWDFRNFWHSTVWNIQFDFFPSLNWEKIPVWNTKLAKSKIPVRVVMDVSIHGRRTLFHFFYIWNQ